MSSFLLLNRVYRLEIQSVMLVFSTPLVYSCPSTYSLTSPPPSSQSKQTVKWEGGEGLRELSCVVDHILFLTRFRTHKIATPLQTKMTSIVKSTFYEFCVHRPFISLVLVACFLGISLPPTPRYLKTTSTGLPPHRKLLYAFFARRLFSFYEETWQGHLHPKLTCLGQGIEPAGLPRWGASTKIAFQ